MMQMTEPATDAVESLTDTFDDSNNVVDYNVKHYDTYDSLLVTFDPKGFNFVLLHGDYDIKIMDISAVNAEGTISAVIHVYGDHD